MTAGGSNYFVRKRYTNSPVVTEICDPNKSRLRDLVTFVCTWKNSDQNTLFVTQKNISQCRLLRGKVNYLKAHVSLQKPGLYIYRFEIVNIQ